MTLDYQVCIPLQKGMKEAASNSGSTTYASWNGGTKYYQAPELFGDGAKGKFYKKSDVFAAGIVFLEVLSLRPPQGLFKELWPSILGKGLALPLEQVLSGSLEINPAERKSFGELFAVFEVERNLIEEFCSNSNKQQLFEMFLKEGQSLAE